MPPGILRFLPLVERKIQKKNLFDLIELMMVGFRTNQDVVLPLGTPIKGVDGREMDQVPMPKGTTVLVNVSACNTDPEIWGSDCCEWKPERWLDGLPESVTSARIPGVFANM